MPTSDRRRPRTADLQATIDRQAELIARLSQNRTFNCLTRQGLDLALEELDLTGRVCLYWDLDEMKAANSRWGKEDVNRRIGQVNIEIRTRAEDASIVVGQVYSGDEFAAFPTAEDAPWMAQRLLAAFQAVGLSGTFVILAPEDGEGPTRVLARADHTCDSLKKTGHRGAIYIVPKGAYYAAEPIRS